MQHEQDSYIRLINVFEIPRNDTKDAKDYIVDIFDIKVNTTTFTTHFSKKKT